MQLSHVALFQLVRVFTRCVSHIPQKSYFRTWLVGASPLSSAFSNHVQTSNVTSLSSEVILYAHSLPSLLRVEHGARRAPRADCVPCACRVRTVCVLRGSGHGVAGVPTRRPHHKNVCGACAASRHKNCSHCAPRGSHTSHVCAMLLHYLLTNCIALLFVLRSLTSRDTFHLFLLLSVI